MISCNSRAWAEIDLSKVEHNVEEIRKLIPKTTKIMGIVKANSYGHGDIELSRALQACGVDFFGVSSIDEAVHLREAGINEDILVLGYTPPEHFHFLAEMNIKQTLISVDYAHCLDAYCQQHAVCIACHIKVDTGMSRLGIQCKDEVYCIDDVIALYSLKHLKVEGIFSHFSVSDSLDAEDDLAFTTTQIRLFDKVLSDLAKAGINPGIRHIQNSYGILNYGHLQYDYVRPGLLFLGITSDDALRIHTKPKFLPIMTLKANVSLVKWIEKGCCVSYGRHYTAPCRRKTATLTIGYADGVPRTISNKGAYVLIHGQKAHILGNICMDQMIVDVTNIKDVVMGDEAVLFGYDGDVLLNVDQMSRFADTINNETMCRITARVPRIYK